MEIWKKTKNSDKKEFDGESAYSEKYLKAKKNAYNGKLNTKFHNIKIPKVGSKFICLLIKLIDFVFRTGKKYYPQVFLEECKYVVKQKKCLSLLLKLLLILIEKISMKKISYSMCLVFIFLMSQMKQVITFKAFRVIHKIFIQ